MIFFLEKIINKTMDKLQLKKLKKLKLKADDAYFNGGTPIMTDEAYDGLCQRLCQHLNESEIDSVGCLPKLDKVKLPIYMGSLTKHNDDKLINSFLNKFNHVSSFTIQEKLDGVSCLYVYNNGQINLYTRGNGNIGTNITHLLYSGLSLPTITETKINFMVRGELIISKKNFTYFSDQFKNGRNMISGQISTKTPNKLIIQNIDFVGYEVIFNSTKQVPLVKQYQFLKDYNFKVVYNRTIDKKFMEQEILMDYLNRRKRKGEYQIDGLVVTINDDYSRNDSGNPDYSFAFKIQGETAEVHVEHVKWNLSKCGKYKPQIFITPVELNGVTISTLTGFNAKYIVDHNIVAHTTLLITRSGDVIPHIITVLNSPENGIVELPENSRWNSVDLYHSFDTDPDEVKIKQIVYFFTSLKCLNCKEKTITKIFNAGFKSIEAIIQSKATDLSKIEGIGMSLATKLLSSIISNVQDASIHELLAAYNAFGEGIGLKKIQNIDLSLNLTKLETFNFKGLSNTTIKEKILPVWNQSLARVQNLKQMVGSDFNIEKIENNQDDNNPLENKIFVFTGFRDVSLEKEILNLGGKVTSAISKKTNYLITSDETKGKKSTKLIRAESLGIIITTKSECVQLVQKFKLSNPEVEYDDYSDYSDYSTNSEN